MKPIKLNLDKAGAKYIAPALSGLTAKKLGVSKYEFSKIKRQIKNDKLDSKYIPILMRGIKSSIQYGNDDKWRFNVPDTIIEKLSKTKYIIKDKKKLVKTKSKKKFVSKGEKSRQKPKYVWVKFECFKNDKFFKSAVLEFSKVKKLNKFISDYAKIALKQYDKYPIYITNIYLQLI